ncbi:MAG: hypothetical protein HC930_03060 [Hydrococcus sp. SU_1_0]|nr:hypothetical protein [Hydrococcus sp. SU_1_0]
MKDLYQLPEGYILNPFTFLYQNPDIEISDPTIVKVLEKILYIEDERLDLDLPEIERLLKLDTLAFVRQGCLYATIKFNRLYKKTHSSFKQYCEEVLGKSVYSVNNYIEAARIMIELMTAGFEYSELPNNMSSALMLKEFSGSDLVHVWRDILAELEPHKRTANRIKNYLYPEPVKKEDIYTKIELPLAIYSKLLEVAYNAKMSVGQIIENVVLTITDGFKKSEISKYISWVLDMKKLVDDY